MGSENIEFLINLISTSQAVYGNLYDQSMKLEDILRDSSDFTEQEADKFVSRFEIAAPFETKDSGFQAILFRDKIDNKYVFAIRGSEQLAQDFAYADGADIGRFGFAAEQAADMYRYWKKLTAPRGQQVVYSQKEILQLYLLINPTALPALLALPLGGLMNLLPVFSATAKYVDLVNSLNADAGFGAISPSEKVDVTGHSLGGNLAEVFSSMFPNNVGDVVTHNAPSINGGPNILGVGITGQEILEFLGFSIVNQRNLTSVTAEGDLVHHTSGSQIGSVVNISQEVGHGAMDGLANNHSVINGLDSLNVMNLFAKLDTSQADRPSGVLVEIMRASSNVKENTFENMVDALRYMILGEAEEKTTVSTKNDLEQRGELYANMESLVNSSEFKKLAGKVNIVKVSPDPQLAKYDYGQFLALYFHSPFALIGSEDALKDLNPALYALWNSDQALSVDDKTEGKKNFSDVWYVDRSEFLERLIVRNTDDNIIFNDRKNHRLHVANFSDILSGISFTSEPVWVANSPFSSNQIPMLNVVFGGKNVDEIVGNQNEDHLYGGAGNDTLSGKEGCDYLEGNADNDLLYGGDDADHLFGGAGDDQLFGEGGNDILEGGTGNDTYSFTGAFGSDVIKDADDNGSIVISGETLSSLLQSAPGSNVYYDNLTNPTKRAVLLDEGDIKSLIVSTVTQTGKNIITSGNSVTIKNWSNGNLGLSLQATNPTAAADVRTINGTAGNNAITLENVKDTNGSYTTGVTALYADGGAGRDIIMGSLSTNDTLLGGEGSDIISGGFIDNLTDSGYSGRLLPTATTAGKDFIDGGKGDDYIFASVGGGVAHGGDDNDILSSRAGAYFLLNNQEALTEDPAKYNNHGVIKRDDIWGDLLAQRVNFGITVSEGNTYTYDTSITKDLTNAFVEYTGSVTGIHYIAKLGSGNSSYNSGGFGINYSGVYTYAYDYNKENNAYRVTSNANLLSPINVVVPEFSLASGHTYAEYANQTGANLFGDKGNDTLYGGMFADILSGGDDNDVFMAGGGHDIIDGGSGNDEVYGEDGNDLINGGDGDDTLSGSDSSDILAAGVGDNDTIYGGKGVDYLFGGRGNDYLEGGTGGDYLLGEDGNDYLYGGDDDEKDVLIGGLGDDTIVLHRKDYADGQSGNNIYIYDTHEVTTAPLPVTASAALSQTQLENTNIITDNNNTSFANLLNSNTTSAATQTTDLTYIFNTEGQNTLALVGVSSLDEFAVTLIDGQLQLSDSNRKLVIDNAATGAPVKLVFGDSIEQLAAATFNAEAITDDHFLNGTAPLEQAQLTTADIILATHANTVALTGLTANQYLAGGLINDTLTANSQGTRFIGGRGDDKLIGSTADDTYLIRKGDGNDTIIEQGGNNHIKLDKNINAADVKASRTGADLLLTLSPEQSILVKNMFDTNTGALLTASAIADITFYNGDLWDINHIKQRALLGSDTNDLVGGFETNDVISGGKGNDQLQGAAGNDTYRYTLGDGQDIITDTQGTDSIQLSGGITAAQVIATRDGNNNLVLGFSDGGKITVANAFDASGNFTANAIESIVFSDNNTWSQAQIKTEVLKDQAQQYTGTTSDDLIKGSTGKDIINGGKGNDRLQGDVGNDVYQYALGDGKDIILDLNGTDSLEFLSGILPGDVVTRSNGNDLVLALSDGGSITVKDMFVTKTAHTVDPQITALIDQLQTRWISQTSNLIKNNYGLEIRHNMDDCANDSDYLRCVA